jgi:hypothetical protein
MGKRKGWNPASYRGQVSHLTIFLALPGADEKGESTRQRPPMVIGGF